MQKKVSNSWTFLPFSTFNWWDSSTIQPLTQMSRSTTGYYFVVCLFWDHSHSYPPHYPNHHPPRPTQPSISPLSPLHLSLLLRSTLLLIHFTSTSTDLSSRPLWTWIPSSRCPIPTIPQSTSFMRCWFTVEITMEATTSSTSTPREMERLVA